MGSYLDKPITTKETDHGSGNGVMWGSSCMQGWRSNMEDAHITEADLSMHGGQDFAAMSMFAVFDGHGGKEVAIFCKKHVPSLLCKHLAELRCDSGGESAAEPPNGGMAKEPNGEVILEFEPSVIQEALVRTFHQLDDMLRLPEYYEKAFPAKKWEVKSPENDATPSSSSSQAAEATANSDDSPLPFDRSMSVKLKPIDADDEKKGASESESPRTRRSSGNSEINRIVSVMRRLSNRQEMISAGGPAASCGCTAVVCVITPTHIICGNAGDSRAVLCREGNALALSNDHKPNEPSERQRIEAAGGRVEAQQGQVGRQPRAKGQPVIHRVRPGGLSLSRAIGDLQGKMRHDLGPEQQVVCATPEVLCVSRSHGKDEFLIIACDGIWDVKSSADTCRFIQQKISRGTSVPIVMEDLMTSCMCKNPQESFGIGADNMTCVLVMLQDPESVEGRQQKRCIPFLCGRRGGSSP